MHTNTKAVKNIFLPCLLFLALGNASIAQETDTVGTKKIIAVKKALGPQVNGVVTEAATGKPLPGINVSVTGYAAALTDENGKYKINVPDLRAVVVISGQGYQSKEEALKGRKTISSILYEESYSSVYDAAVLPFGTVLKNRTPYAVTSISPNGSWERGNETPDSYIQGKVAGLEAIRRSGTPDIGADLYLRGYNSLYAANQPLVVVDGVIYDINAYGSSIISGHRTNHLANVDIKDIDNITILKDGTSMYGTRGANGAILITTGRAKDVATRLDFSAYGGYNGTAKNLPVMGADHYRIFLNDVLRTRPGFTDAMIKAEPYMNDNAGPDYYNYHQQTNWQDKVAGSGISQNYYLRVTGGDEVAT